MATLFLSPKAVAERYGVHRSSIWRWSQENPDFPKPIKFMGSRRWRLEDLELFEEGLGK